MESSDPSATRRPYQDAVAELGRQALEADCLGGLLADAVTVTSNALGVEYCSVLEMGDDRTATVRQGTALRDGHAVSIDGTLEGEASTSDGAVVVNDRASGDRVVQPLADRDVASSACVAIGSPTDGDPWGVLGVYAAEQHAFTHDDVDFLENVATLLDSALESGRFDERRRHEPEGSRRVGDPAKLTDRLLEASPVGVIVADENGEMQRANERAEEITGRDREQITTMAHGDAQWDLVDPDGDPLSVDRLPFNRVLETGRAVFDVEFGIRRPDGERVWIVENAVPVYEDGEVAGVVSVFEDVSEEKRLASELETTVERITDAFMGLNTDWTFTYVNDRARELIDPDGEGLIGENIWNVFPEAVDSRFEREYRRAMKAQEPTSFEEYFPPLECWFEVHAYPSESGLSVYFRDVTERKERERELEESERRYRTLIDHFPNGAVALVDENLQYITFGGTLEGDFDVTESSLEGEPLESALPQQVADVVVPHYEAALEGGTATFEETVDDRTYQFHFVPVRDDDGEIFAAMGMSQDVTDRKEYQRRLEASNERLEQFAHAASHDLQEPLRMVSSYLTLLERRYASDLDEEAEEFIEFAVDGADRMQAMIDGLLAYSRVDAGGEPFEPVDLEGVLEAVLTDLAVRITETDAEITVESLPMVEGDRGQLRQLFQNLLENALTYSGEEPPQVSVSARRDGDDWEISVRDQGIGIDPDETEHIFGVFDRLHTVEEYRGTGIGLALCQRIVERHGGEIRVDSEPGEGSTFSVVLPAGGVEGELGGETRIDGETRPNNTAERSANANDD